MSPALDLLSPRPLSPRPTGVPRLLFLRTELGELLEVGGELLLEEVVVRGVLLADGLERRVLQ